MAGLDHTTSQERSQAWNWSHLIASWCLSSHPHPTWISRAQGERWVPLACSVPRVTPDLPTFSQYSVHVPSWCQSPRARLELRTRHAGVCVDSGTCLLLVKQTCLDTKNKSRFINNQKSHNSPQENVHFM